jgi:hypothetical protein
MARADLDGPAVRAELDALRGRIDELEALGRVLLELVVGRAAVRSDGRPIEPKLTEAVEQAISAEGLTSAFGTPNPRLKHVEAVAAGIATAQPALYREHLLEILAPVRAAAERHEVELAAHAEANRQREIDRARVAREALGCLTDADADRLTALRGPEGRRLLSDVRSGRHSVEHLVGRHGLIDRREMARVLVVLDLGSAWGSEILRRIDQPPGGARDDLKRRGYENLLRAVMGVPYASGQHALAEILASADLDDAGARETLEFLLRPSNDRGPAPAGARLIEKMVSDLQPRGAEAAKRRVPWQDLAPGWSG